MTHEQAYRAGQQDCRDGVPVEQGLEDFMRDAVTQTDALSVTQELGKCPFCESDLNWRLDDIEGWVAYVSCVGCDMQGPISDFKYDCQEEAKADSLARWLNGFVRLSHSTPGDAEVRRAAEPWADFHGDLPDYDHPLRCVFESGIQYAVELLAKTLRVEDYEICDGTEEFDGDLGGTLFNIVLAAMPTDEHGDPLHPEQVRKALATPSGRAQGEVERDLFEAGFMGCWSEMFVKSDGKPAFELSDKALDRAWEIYLATREDAAPPAQDQGEGNA